MAHPVDLEAKLNTLQVEQKLNNLANNANKKLDTPSSISSKGIDGLSESLKAFRNAIGGGVLALSLGLLAKSMDLFGDKTDKVVNLFTGTFNRMLAAIGSGNPVIIALTAALETLSYVMGNVVESTPKKPTEEDIESNLSAIFDYARQKEVKQTIASGDLKQMEALLARLAPEQQFWNENVDKLKGNSSAAEFQKAFGNLKRVEGIIEQIQEAYIKVLEAQKKAAEEELKKSQEAAKKILEAQLKAAEEQEKRQKELSEAKESFQWNEDFRSAIENQNTTWLEDAFNKAIELMRSAESASEFNAAAGQATRTRDALQNIAQGDLASLQDQLKSLIGIQSPVSGFSAAGFSMGELMSSIDTISRNVEQIVMLMREQMQKSLASYNTGSITL